MSRSFNGKKSFGCFKESKTSGDYIDKLKTKSMFCNVGIKNKVKNQSELNLLRHAKLSCPDSINTTNLNINLISRLDLSGVSVIVNSDGSSPPTPINLPTQLHIDTPYLQYVIDPDGELFGNTPCGTNNFTLFMVFVNIVPGFVPCLLPMDDEESYPYADNLFNVNTYSFSKNGMNFRSARLASLLGVTNTHFNLFDQVPYNLRQQRRDFDTSSAIFNVTNIGNTPYKSYFYIQTTIGSVIIISGYIVVDTNTEPGIITEMYEVADYNNIPPISSIVF